MKYVLDSSIPIFRYFEDICAIPHNSFHEKGVSDYVVRFAEEHHLEYRQDEHWNVVIKKPASAGYEKSETVMLQAHLDMVCEKTPESIFNFDTDPLQLRVVDGYLMATDTTIGLDDGYGVAYMLAILADDSIPHPALECLFTVEEEVGCGGPRYLDFSDLTAKRLINLDVVQEGSTNVSTSNVYGGDFKRPVVFRENRDACYSLHICGLSAGHASLNIIKDQANAIKLAARMLYAIEKEYKINIAYIKGGTKRNGIPEECDVTFSCKFGDVKSLKAITDDVFAGARKEHDLSDPDMKYSLSEAATPEKVMDDLSSHEVVALLHVLPSGSHMRNKRAINPMMSIASSNLGNVSVNDHVLTVGYMFRCNDVTKLYDLYDQITLLASRFGAYYDREYDYYGFTIDPEKSALCKIYNEVYKEASGKDLYYKYTHGGNDPGTIAMKMGGMDIITIGPDIFDVHRPTERAELGSYTRAYGYLTEVLKRLK